IDLLFASNSPFVWATEKRFQELKLEHSDIVRGAHHNHVEAQGELKGAHNQDAVYVEDYGKRSPGSESI
ncbi:hypothetical protein MMC08_007201, partial [Hypocenomyce scalaris]|nr:hypothetical protein [Hypocenomyce scalaris]